MSKTISNSDDIIDSRDIIERIDELEDIEGPDGEDDELATLRAFMDELKGNGGDEQWRGDWYPVTCIRDSYFKTYAQELAEDIGVIDSNARWPNPCIDWDQAARELRMDYAAVDFYGVTYWVR